MAENARLTENLHLEPTRKWFIIGDSEPILSIKGHNQNGMLT